MAQQTSSVVVSEFLLACKDDVLKVKDLFHDRKYRRCAVLCSQALQEATHPLHRTFLYFHQAVCYESLGHISHNYSGNKIPLLEQARDSFISANDSLPLPFLTQINGSYDEPKPSPLCATNDLLEFYCDSPSIYAETTPFHGTERRGRSLTRSTSDRDFEEISVIYTVPDFDEYSPRVPLAELSKNGCDRQMQVFTSRNNRSNHKTRLSASLSSKHVLAEELVPSPLYSRAPSSRKAMSTFIVSTASPMPLVTLGKPLPPTPINRPLPMLPFNPHPNFMLKGKRIVIVPNRKTALSTLIQKFERKSPFDASPGQLSTHESIHIDPTPTTERFKRISAVFDTKHDDDKENQPPGTPFGRTIKASHAHLQPVTPCPKPQLHRPTHKHDTNSVESLSHLDLYNTHLSSFRTSLLAHISSVSKTITKTRTIQLAHEAEKRRNFAAMSSYPHCHASASSIPAPSRSKSRGRSTNRNSRLSPVKDARLRSFWSLQAAEVSERVENANGGDRKAKERKERIEKLKKNGWRDVRKEAKGWKGEEYYAELRRSVEEELMIVGC